MLKKVEHNPSQFNEGDRVRVIVKSPISHYGALVTQYENEATHYNNID
jgi:hypothetical protein